MMTKYTVRMNLRAEYPKSFPWSHPVIPLVSLISTPLKIDAQYCCAPVQFDQCQERLSAILESHGDERTLCSPR